MKDWEGALYLLDRAYAILDYLDFSEWEMLTDDEIVNDIRQFLAKHGVTPDV